MRIYDRCNPSRIPCTKQDHYEVYQMVKRYSIQKGMLVDLIKRQLRILQNGKFFSNSHFLSWNQQAIICRRRIIFWAKKYLNYLTQACKNWRPEKIHAQFQSQDVHLLLYRSIEYILLQSAGLKDYLRYGQDFSFINITLEREKICDEKPFFYFRDCATDDHEIYYGETCCSADYRPRVCWLARRFEEYVNDDNITNIYYTETCCRCSHNPTVLSLDKI